MGVLTHMGSGALIEKIKYIQLLVSNHFGADHYNDSVCASSNDEIVERTLRWLKDNTCDHAIIMMTHDGRMKLNVRFMPHRTGTQRQIELNDMFYRNFYNDELGATNFYRNRYILEQAFEKRNIPLLLYAIRLFTVSRNKYMERDV